MITAESVIQRIETYFHGGTARYLNGAEWDIAARAFATPPPIPACAASAQV
jgi:hypothetical protein